MPQLQLPMFPVGVTPITSLLAFIKEEENIIYFNGSLPVFSHKEEDTRSFQMITAQFCVNGHTQQAEITRAFGGNSYIEQVQQLLSEHEEVADIAIKFDIKPDTLSKAIRAGRLHKPAKKKRS